MKLVELGLAPFGPFSSLKLDLSAPAGLHLVYGKNEAGKSTTLRAITGLLYGIPHDTGDAHKHRMPELRIAGRLARDDGSVLDVVRRKGLKNTLLDPEGRPIDELVLARALGGVSEDLFRAMFGLDHETLRRGAEALLRGKGDLGETLFDAGVGGAAVGDVLAELEKAADDLYRRRATTSRINRGLKQLSDKRKSAREAISDPAAYEKQTELADAAERELAEIENERRELRAERQRLERIRRALPKLRERASKLELRAAIHGPIVSAEIGARRVSLEREREKLGWDRERLRAELAHDAARGASLQYSERLAALDDERAELLVRRLGAHIRAAEDLPKRRVELVGVEREAQAVLARLGTGVQLEQAESLRIDAPTQARIRELARTHATLVRLLADAERQRAEAQAELESVKRAGQALPPARDVSGLAATLAAAQRLGDLDARVREAKSALDAARQKAESRRGALGLKLPLEALSALPVLDEASVERFERELSELGQRRARVEAELERVGGAERRLERERAELARAGEVPSEALLEQARAERDKSWLAVRRACLERAELGEPALSAFERATQRADEVADLLRRDADRVARAAAIELERAEIADGKRTLGQELEQLQKAGAEHAAQWTAAWRASNIAPKSPREMRSWLEQFARLLALVDTVDERQGELVREQALLSEHCEALRGELARLGLESSELTSLAALFERARAVLDKERNQDAEQRRHAELEQEIERRLAALDARVIHAQAELGSWTEQWQDAVRALAQGPARERTPGPEEVTSTLDLLDALFRALDRVAGNRHRIAGMQRDAEEFAAEVAALVSEHAPELAGEPAPRAADALVREHASTRRTERARAEIEVRISDKRSELAEVEARVELLDAELSGLLSEASVSSLAELAQAEQRGAEARELEHRIRELELSLAEDLGGRTLEELEAEARDVDFDRSKVRLLELEETLELLDERWKDAHARLQSAKHGLERFGHSTAVHAEQEAQELASELREDTERYLRLRMAAIVLRREIERYREKHQGPVVSRASALFRKLTRGSFRALRADVDAEGEPILSCVREDGSLVEVSGLSEGSSEQLYLALRLASLEHYGEHNELLPLVLDDVLLHSDEDRTLAALELLGELGERMQILLFSHHAHLVELARQAVPAPRLAVHELGATLD